MSKLESQTNWDALAKMTDEDIDLSDIPEITAEQMDRAIMRVGGKVVPRKKVRVTMYLDANIVEHFKAKAGSRGYQTLINNSLQTFLTNESNLMDMENTLRSIIREELQTFAIPSS